MSQFCKMNFVNQATSDKAKTELICSRSILCFDVYLEDIYSR
jgi:hypothetical protein